MPKLIGRVREQKIYLWPTFYQWTLGKHKDMYSLLKNPLGTGYGEAAERIGS